MTKKAVSLILVLLSVAALAAGVWRKELKPLYVNAMTICYSCIGLQ